MPKTTTETERNLLQQKTSEIALLREQIATLEETIQLLTQALMQEKETVLVYMQEAQTELNRMQTAHLSERKMAKLSHLSNRLAVTIQKYQDVLQ